MKRSFLCIAVLILMPFLSTAQVAVPFKIKTWYKPFMVNGFDKNKEYHGRWKIYINNDKDLIRNGRFKHGKEAGTWRYYYPEGGLYIKEKYKRNSPVVLVWRYHKNGKLAKSGTARIYRDETMAHYYWEGVWQVYDEQGNFTHTVTYVKGNLQKKNL